MHIYVISLEKDVQKRIDIRDILRGFNLEFSFIDAINGIDISDTDLSSIRAKSVGAVSSRGIPAIPGEIGCTLSHLKAYKEMIKNNQEYACILEDDVILDQRFKVFINTFQSTKMNSKDLYLLGGQFQDAGYKYIIKSNKNVKFIGKQVFYKTIRSQYLVQRSCCYIISSDMAKDLSKLYIKKFILADDWGYLSANKHINRIYLSDFVKHPIDLSMSNLQKAREDAVLKSQPKRTTYIEKIKNKLKRNLRFKILTVYKIIEWKDN